MASMAGPDHLFNLRNNFYLGAYQAAINNSEIPNLSQEDIVERDCLVHRAYIALGSYQLVISEIDEAAATPLQAVKLLAMYQSSPENKESTISSLMEWLADPTVGNNAIIRLIAGTIFMHEEDYNEALKHTHSGGTMDLHALNVQIFIKMHRSDHAEKQLRVMQQIDEDHTLTQLASAWESTISSLMEWLADPTVGNNAIIRLIAGTIFMHEEDYNEALKHTHSGGTMDLHALNVQIFIKMHRSDHAEKQLRVMQQIDEDHTLTQLASAWVNLAVGGSKIQEAYLIFQDFSEKYPMTSLILNGKAVCCMHMNNFEEAETLLLEALNKDAKDPETLANLVVCSLHVGKSSSRYLNQLKLSNPEHVLVKRAASAEDNFERAFQTFA